MSTAADRATSSAVLSRTLSVACVGARPVTPSIAGASAHGITWCGEGEGERAASAALVFATVGSGAAVQARRAVQLATQTKRPLVLALADSWALGGWRRFATPWHLQRERRAMARALRAAQCVFVRTPALAAECESLGVAPDRLVALPDGLAATPVQPSQDASFRIWIASKLQPAVDPPGATRDGLLSRQARHIEPIGATGFHLFSALAALREKRPAVFARLRVRSACAIDPTNLDIIDWLGLESMFESGIGRPERADAAFVCQAAEVADNAIDLADALFPALSTGLPLLAALPPGDGRDLVRALGAGPRLPATDTPRLVFAIEHLVAARDRGEVPSPRPSALLAHLDGAQLAGVVAATMHAIAAGAPLPPAVQGLWPPLLDTGPTAA